MKARIASLVLAISVAAASVPSVMVLWPMSSGAAAPEPAEKRSAATSPEPRGARKKSPSASRQASSKAGSVSPAAGARSPRATSGAKRSTKKTAGPISREEALEERRGGARTQATTSPRTHLSALALADPYEWSHHFQTWWSLTQVPIDLQRGAAWLETAMQKSARSLMDLLSEASAGYEQRRTNMRRGLVVLYLLGRESSQCVAIPPPPVAYHRAVLRLALRSDAEAVAGYAAAQEQGRAAMAQLVAASRREALAQGFVRSLDQFEGITISEVELVAHWNAWLLELVAPPQVEDVSAIVRGLADEQRKRAALTSLAPPSPDALPSYWPLVGEDVPLPVEPLPTPRRSIADERMAPPSRRALMFRVAGSTAVHCVEHGVVEFVGEVRGLDTVVIVAHEGGLLSVYGQLQAARVARGQKVSRGDIVGIAAASPESGESAVIFEVRSGAQSVAPERLLGDRNVRRALFGQEP